MAHQKTKPVAGQFWLEWFTLKDKKSMFRASGPDEYHLQLLMKVEPHSTLIVREFVFEKKENRDQKKDELKRLLGLPEAKGKK